MRLLRPCNEDVVFSPCTASSFSGTVVSNRTVALGEKFFDGSMRQEKLGAHFAHTRFPSCQTGFFYGITSPVQ